MPHKASRAWGVVSKLCTRQDVFGFGVRADMLSNPARPIADVGASTDVLTCSAHGFAPNAVLTFRAEEGGSLPAPLVEGTSYYAIPLTDSTFSVSATPSGAPIDLITAGSNVVVSSQLPIDDWIEWASSLIENSIPAHIVPLSEPYPPIVVACTADLVAWRALAYTGGASGDITEKLKAAQSTLTTWAKGVPIRGQNAPGPALCANMAISSTCSGVDPRGWLSRSGNARIP